MKKFSLILLACGFLYAGPLGFESGTIKAHTEVFGDSSIDPMVKKANPHLWMEDAVTTLHGTIEINMAEFMSDNRKRDEHMHESFESAVFPKAVFEIKEVVSKGSDAYTLKGTMSFHGFTKAMSFESTITQDAAKVHLKANGGLKMSDFGMKPIKMLFLTVRDQVDLSVEMVLKR